MNKAVLKSKTFYLGLITALAPLFPGASEVISSNPEIVAQVLGGVIIVLRFFTKDKVVIK